MSIPFPSTSLFEAIKQRIADDPTCMQAVEPSDAYCGFAIGDRLFVVEFDGRECCAVVAGGNPIDLDFVLAGKDEDWRRAIVSGVGPDALRAQVEAGTIEIRSEADGGADLARAALAFLEAFLAPGRGLELG